MATGHDLPDEVLLHILEDVVSSAPIQITQTGPGMIWPRVQGLAANKQTFRSLCLSSRRLRAIAEPYLYASFKRTISTPSVQPFLRTILERPELGSHVRAINLETWATEADAKDPASPSEIELFQSAAGQLKLPRQSAEELEKQLQLGVEEAQLALLFFQVPRLQYAIFWLPSNLGSPSKSLLFNTITAALSGPHTKVYLNSPTFLKHLSIQPAVSRERSVHTYLFPGGVQFSMSWLVPFLQIPSLEELWCANCSGTLADTLSIRWPSRSSPVSTVRFRNSILHADGIFNFSRSLSGLKSLEMEMPPGSSSFDGIAYALSPQASSLQKLTIQARHSGFTTFGHFVSGFSMRDFTALKHMDLSFEVMESLGEHASVASLPPNLEKLSIRDGPLSVTLVQPPYNRVLWNVARLWVPQLPKLKTVDGKEIASFCSRLNPDQAMLRACFEGCGVDLLLPADDDLLVRIMLRAGAR